MLPIGVIELGFDPVLQLAGLEIRWQTIGVTIALLDALALVALIASRTPAMPRGGGAPLGIDDLGYIVLGVVPGAVIGGRLIHGAAFWHFYAQDPMSLLDPAVGSLSLLGAVLGGMLSGAYVASLLTGSVARWADVAAAPMLLALALGKLAQLLGGSGQGVPFDGPWAVAFVGAGPWHSLQPEVPSHPAQAYEAVWLLLGIGLLLLLRSTRLRAEGMAFGVALGWFLLGRIVVGFSWRDEPLVGPLNAEQLLALLALVNLLGGYVLWRLLRSPRPKPGYR